MHRHEVWISFVQPRPTVLAVAAALTEHFHFCHHLKKYLESTKYNRDDMLQTGQHSNN